MSHVTSRAELPVIWIMVLLFACSSKSNAIESNEKESAPKPVLKQDASPKAEDPLRSVSGVDRRRTSRTKVNGPRVGKLKWVFRTQGRIYGDAALGDDGAVYVPSHDGHLYAVGSDGRQLWSFDAGGKIWSSPAVAADGTIYFGSDADKLFAIYANGQPRWIFSTTNQTTKGKKDIDSKWDVDTAPMIAKDGTVYFGCHYYLFALRPDGEVRWRFQAGVDRVKIFSSPAVGERGAIYFGTQGKRLFALDQNANVLWNVTTEGDNDSTPAVGDDGSVYFGSDDGKVRALGPDKGELIWETPLGAPIRAPLALGHDGTVFASVYAAKPFIAALDGKTGTEKWRFHTREGEGDFYGIQSGALVDGEGYIYFGGRDHYIYCLSPKGKLVWRYKTGDQVDTRPVLGPDGTLYVGSDDRRLYAFSR